MYIYISGTRLNKSIVFGSCVIDKFRMNPKWINIEELLLSLNNNPKPKTILNIAEKGLKYQIFDISLWNNIYNTTLKVQNLYSMSDWVNLLHIYRRMKIYNKDLYNIAYNHLINKIHMLTIQDSSKLVSSYAYFAFCPIILFNEVANIIINIDKIHNENQIKSNKDIESLIHLLNACSKCNINNKKLFEVVANLIIKSLESENIIIPSQLLLRLIHSFHKFGYRHIKLFDLLSREIVTSKFNMDELNNIKNIFDSLNYQNDLLNKTFSFKLANFTTFNFLNKYSNISPRYEAF